MYRVAIKREASQAILETASYYETAREGLGRELESEVEALLQAIAIHPQMYPEISSGIRRALIRRFKQHLFYRLEGDTVLILNFRDARREPPRDLR